MNTSQKKKKPINASHGYLGKVAQKNVYNQIKTTNEKFSPDKYRWL